MWLSSEEFRELEGDTEFVRGGGGGGGGGDLAMVNSNNHSGNRIYPSHAL